MAACESIRIDAVHCDALRKELSAENKIRLPQRMFPNDRDNCFSQINIQIWIIMACSSLNIEKPINLVQKYQFLYGKSHKYYCNNIRENAWTETSNSLGNMTDNYIILYSVIYILRNFCNVLQYEIHIKFWNFTIMTIISIINNNMINYWNKLGLSAYNKDFT